jgi:DNA-binding NtrC family response regulator
VGGHESIRVDVRVLAATNRDLETHMRDGRFREDLFYRLNVLPIHVPPLRERREDIPTLVKHFTRPGTKGDGLKFSPDALTALQHYDYPGNVRELQNLIERLQVLSSGEEILPRHLPPEYRRPTESGGEVIQCFRTELGLREALQEFEARFIERVLQEEGGNRTAAARRLGISRKNLWEKLAD